MKDGNEVRKANSITAFQSFATHNVSGYDFPDGSARRGGQSVFSFIELLNAFEAIDARH